MAPNTFEISADIIFPRASAISDGSVFIDLSPPPHSSSHDPTPAPSTLPSGPGNPLYRLPQSLSSGGLKIHLNRFVPTKSLDLNRRSAHSSIDEDHIIFEISKSRLGEGGGVYILDNFAAEKDEGGYGKGRVSFTPGWISGGYWNVEYKSKKPGQVAESRVDLKFDEGGSEDKIWKMTYPMEGVVARELEQPEGAFGENGRALEIVEGMPGLEGWSEKEWREFLMAVFVTKVWRDCTTSQGWLGTSVKSVAPEVGGLGNW